MSQTKRDLGQRRKLYLTRDEVLQLRRERPICGVYFLFKDDAVVYVGQSKNVYLRVVRHRSRKVSAFDSFAILECEERQLTFLEAYYIKTLAPPLNVARPVFYRNSEGHRDMESLMRTRAA